MEREDVRSQPTGIEGVALGSGMRWVHSVDMEYRPRCHGNRRAVLATDAHPCSRVHACDDCESVEFRCGDVVTDNAAIRDLTSLGVFRHRKHMSFHLRAWR